MSELERIKRYVDRYGVGSAILNDHVAISIMWRSVRADGEERRMETIQRAASMCEACAIVGCRCADRDCAECQLVTSVKKLSRQADCATPW